MDTGIKIYLVSMKVKRLLNLAIEANISIHCSLFYNVSLTKNQKNDSTQQSHLSCEKHLQP